MGVKSRRCARPSGLVVLLDALAHHEPVDQAAAVRVVRIGLIERNDEDGIAGRWVQVAAVDQRLQDVGLEPCIGNRASGDRAIMAVITSIGSDEGIIRQRPIGKVMGKS